MKKYNNLDIKAEHEIVHGKKLSSADPEEIWGWKTPAGMRRAQRRAKIIATAASLQGGKYVLEIGCGTGFFTEIFAQAGARIIAVDISGDLLALAKMKKIDSRQVQFLEMKFENCRKIGPFDAIIGSSILHHLDIKPALKTIFDLLKPGGMMSFAEPNMLNPQIAVQKNIPWLKRKMGESPDETAFFRWQIKKLLSKKGFTEIKITPFDWLHPQTPKPLINVVEKVGLLLEKIPGIREFSGSLHISARKP